MHPQIKQAGPGACPICGMALEPLDPGAHDNSEYRDMLRRLWISLALSVPVFALAMLGGMLDGIISPVLREWVEAALAAPVVLWIAAPFFVRGWKGVVSGHANMFTLIGLGVGVAFVYSLFALLFPEAIPAAYRGMGGVPPVYFEASAVIVTLVLFGQVLELRARANTGAAVRALLNLAPKIAHRKTASGIEDVPLSDVQPGDALIVKPGDAVPTDGEVIEGESAIDESMISGESIPVEKAKGDGVTGGTLNGQGALTIRATAVGANTMLAKIVALVAEAAAEPRADARSGRRRGGVVRARCGRHRARYFRSMVLFRAPTVVRLRPDCGSIGTDYCVSLRTGPRNTDVGDGQRGPRCTVRRAGEKRSLAGTIC